MHAAGTAAQDAERGVLRPRGDAAGRDAPNSEFRGARTETAEWSRMKLLR